MPSATNVVPNKWTNISVLYDDNTFSAIWGRYDGYKHYTLAVRWNGQGEAAGYPNQGKNPLWFNIPDYLSEGMLRDIRSRLLKSLIIDAAQLQTPMQLGKKTIADRMERNTKYLRNVDSAEGEFNRQKLGEQNV